MITRNALLDLMVSRTCQSTANEPEDMLEDAELVRAADDLVMLQASALAAYGVDSPGLLKLAKAQRLGTVVSKCLRAFEEFRADPNRALAAVYATARSISPGQYPLVMHSTAPGDSPPSLAQAFASGRAAQAKSTAAELYADCLVVLSCFVSERNRKKVKAV